MSEEERARRIKQVREFLRILAGPAAHWRATDEDILDLWSAFATIALEAIDDREDHSHD